MIDKYTELFIEYSNEDNSVYISGLCRDGRNDFWEEIVVETDIADPESYAWGVSDILKRIGMFSTVQEIND